MQYLLSEKEYNDLVEKREKKTHQEIDKLQKFCTRVANELPINSWLGKATPWGCMLSVDGEWYCDECPAENICPYDDKDYSK